MGDPRIATNIKDLERGLKLPEKRDRHHYTPNTISPSNTYFEEVARKSQQRPWLESLHQFMNPNVRSFALNTTKRTEHFDIKVIHIATSGKPDEPIRCSNRENFEWAVGKNGEQIGTVIIAKGISRAMIEALGSNFDIEPEFFASHLAGTELYRLGRVNAVSLRAPARSPSLLPDYVRNAPFYTMEYRRPYRIEGGQESLYKLRMTETNTPRGVFLIHKELVPDFFGAEKVSVYRKTGSNIGIILTDQLISTVPSSSYISNPIKITGNDTKQLAVESLHQQISSRKDIISWIRHLQPSEAKDLFNNDRQLAIQPVLRMVETNTVMFLSYVQYITNRVFAYRCDDALFPDSISFFLEISRSVQRHVTEQKKLLKQALYIASLRCRTLEDIKEQKQDFEMMASNMDDVLKCLKEDVRFLVGEASVREGKIVGWVSKFAALFLPVSLLATILSISETGYVRWAVLGGLSVPFVLISIYFMFFWNPKHLNSFRN